MPDTIHIAFHGPITLHLLSPISTLIENYHKCRRSRLVAQFFASQVVHTDVVALNGGLGGTETETDILVPAAGLTSLLGLGLRLRVLEDVRLLLESALGLDGQLGRHGCGVCRRGSVVELGEKLACRVSG
jgi:hypothetical protein